VEEKVTTEGNLLTPRIHQFFGVRFSAKKAGMALALYSILGRNRKEEK
jgi:hypothetical protein